MPFGHPGISAYEYAGVMDRHHHEERAWAKATEQTSSKHKARCDSSTTTELERRKDASLVVAQILELQQAQAQSQSDEAVTTQRRCGTFVNHTPRNYEVHLSPKLAHQPEPSEGLGKLNTVHCANANDNTGTDYSANHSSHGSPNTNRSDKRNSFASIKLDCGIPLNPLIMHPLPAVPTVVPKQRRRSSSAAASIKSSQTGLSKRSLRNFLTRSTPLELSSDDHQTTSLNEFGPTTQTSTPKVQPETANSKRRRRQTPYRILEPLTTDLARHAPLEPLVLHHRREVTGSDVDALPPYVNIDNDSEAATLLAINEYFDSQESTLPKNRSKESDRSFEPLAFENTSNNVKEDFSPFSYTTLFEPEDKRNNHAKRNSKRLSWTSSPFSMASRRRKSVSELSMQSDFTSAARGQYSPYDERFDAVPKILKRVSITFTKGSPVQVHGRSVSSASGKLAPRIPAHDELANTRLNDFNSFLRTTGPSLTNEVKAGQKKKKKGLRVIQVRSRKDVKKGTGKPRTGSNPSVVQLPLAVQLPACAQPKTTSFGTKHVEIVPKSEIEIDAAADQTACLSKTNNEDHHTHRHSVAWTEETLQPLESSSMERVINSVDGTRSPLRSPKPAVKSQSIPVEHHPLLASRQEQTRSRKLRDLKKAKGRVDNAEEAGESADEKLKRVEALVIDLAEALAYSAGFDVGLTPEEMLEAWTKLGRGDE